MSERRDEGSDDRRGNPVAFRGRGFAPRPVPGVGLAVFLILIAAAELGTRTGWISALTLPRPSALETPSRPSSALTSCRTMARPSPLPP